jgi:hypothetical protein
MSNLSELLPTGGGQNSVDFVASGNLASGQAVVLKADGTVEAVTGATEGVGTPATFNAATTGYITSTYDSTNNKVVIAYKNEGGSNYGTAVVGTVSGTTISFGTPVVFRSLQTQFISATFDSVNSKVVIAYQDYGYGVYGGFAIVGTVSGTSISFGTAVAFNSAHTEWIAATYDVASGKIVIAYRDVGNGYKGTAIVGTVSGTAISFGSEVVFYATYFENIAISYDSTAAKVVICGTDGNNNHGYGIVGTVSGTAISFGSAVAFATGSGAASTSTSYNLQADKTVIIYGDTSNSGYPTVKIATLSGTSISFGSAVVVQNAAGSWIGSVYDSSNAKTIFSYVDNGNSNSSYGTIIVGTVSGTSISFGTKVVYNAAITASNAITYDSTNNKAVVGYRDATSSLNHGKGIVFTVGSSNNTSFIGITSEAISNTATGAINTYGGINSVQTGLTIASDYYVQADGSLSTTSTSPAIKVGQAVSATTINMKDLT